ncbi:uncharacterized protein LOC129598358 [Paramacrobiotus metropolitanus]|uniref:uncharacterized protein LOC129598358 n=1 Tax=Paramacrobiotus metropolitanus TaxID=2943436 RepID=UPI002445E0EC|nr:uncharacterized protein LOC129598358 [Paramacrobiotus metropolitanus]
MDCFVGAAAAVLLLFVGLPGSLECPSQKGLSVDRLNQILNEAKQSNGSGTMFLRGYGRPPPTPRFPTWEWPPNTAIMRAPEGGALVIPCNNTNNMKVSHVSIPPAFMYNGKQFAITKGNTREKSSGETNHCCNCTPEISSRGFVRRSWSVSEYDPATGAFAITLHNFTAFASGLYECLHSNGRQLVVTQRYGVIATLLRHEVFDPPMQNVTVRLGDPAEMVCPVRFNFLPEALIRRFLWRKGHFLLMADAIPAVADAAVAWWGFDGFFEVGVRPPCVCNTTMKIASVTWEHAGVYECWFRIDDRQDEWIMQEAHLHVV